MVEKMPCLNKCLNAIGVTNIGSQHSLMKAIENSAIRLKSMEKESKTKPEEKDDTMANWKGKIEKEQAITGGIDMFKNKQTFLGLP